MLYLFVDKFTKLQKILLICVVVFGALVVGIAALPLLAREKSTANAASSPEYQEIVIAVDSNASKTIEIPESFSYAFRWKGDGFSIITGEYGDFEEIKEDHDLFDEEKSISSSIIYYELPRTLAIQNSNATDIKLIVLNPISSTEGSLGAFTAGGRQTNLTSGAHYSDLPIINRQEWGADPALLDTTARYKTPTKFIIHHTALAADPNDYARSVRAIYQFHSVTNGWGDIGYNYLIDPAGNIYEGHVGGDASIGAHTFRLNGGSIGIALLGDFSYQPPTIQATRSLRKLMAERAVTHGISLNWGSTVIGHRDSPYTDKVCPGEEFYKILPVITSQAQTARTQLLAGDISAARQEAIATLTGYADTRLKINFTAAALADKTPSQLTPANSAIVAKSYDANSVTITVESIPGSEGDWSDDTPKRLINLYTIFKLDPNVESIELVTSEVYPWKYNPGNNKSVEFELIGNPLTRYVGNINLGAGNIRIFDETDNEYVADYAVTDNARVQIHYFRHLNIYQDFNFEEGHIYRIEVCDGCVTGAVSGNNLPAYSWKFTVKNSTFSPVYRFWSNALATHFYTPSSSERTKLTTMEPFTTVWDPEGIAFYALTGESCGKGQRVFRFWSNNFQNHFYTINYDEYEKLTTNNALKAVWKYEGVGFCAYDYPRLNALPVYRFWSDRFKGHFYTISESEKDRLISRFADSPEIWRYEKVAFWAMTSAN